MLDVYKYKPHKKGYLAEQKAYEFLQQQGLQLLERNYHCPYGEIDLIMQEQDEIVFVEVRLRTNPLFDHAIESVDRAKQQKILKSATHYLQKKHLLDRVDYRFDIIGFSTQNIDIDWIKDAFCYE